MQINTSNINLHRFRFLERDVRALQSVKDLDLFQRFVTQLAARAGSLLNVSELGRDSGVSTSTANQWLSILEASHLIFRLKPYYRNVGKRLVKSPKIYLEDTGLLCHLLHEISADSLMVKMTGGHVFENLIIPNFRKAWFNRGQIPHFYFYRDSNDNEIDLIVENHNRLVPIEIKMSVPNDLRQLRSLENFCEVFKTKGIVCGMSNRKEALSRSMRYLHFSDVCFSERGDRPLES